MNNKFPAKPADYAQHLATYCPDIQIKSLETEVFQAPTDSNDRTAICSVTLITHDGVKVSDIGIASVGSSNNSSELAIRSARQEAHRLCEETVMALRSSMVHYQNSPAPWAKQTTVIDVQPSPAPSPKYRQEKLNGGGNKPASEKQKALVMKFCKERGMDANSVVHRRFGKGIHTLKGYEINNLIQELKGASY